MLSGGVLLAGGIGTGVAAAATAKEVEAGPAFDDLAGLQQRGTALNAAAIAFYVTGGIAALAGAGWMGAWGLRRAVQRSPSIHRERTP